MPEAQNRNTNGTSDAAHPKKRKGFWSNAFGRSSNAANADENKDDEQPKHKGFMDSLKTNARQAVGKGVMNIAEHEVTKEVEAQLNNTDGSQPTNTTSPNSGLDPSTTASDALSATTNWAKRMVDSAQQKVQSLQNLGS